MKTYLLFLSLMAAYGCGSHVVTPTSPSGPSPVDQPGLTGAFRLSGLVRDAGNANLLENIRVEASSAGAASRTDTAFDGAFSFNTVNGVITLTVSRTGYTTTTQMVTVSADTTIEIELRRTGGRATPCGEAPDVSNRVIPLFSRPFNGEAGLLNYFDHDVPIQFQDNNGSELTACGDVVRGRIDGHEGYDWSLPIGTPLLATTDGTIVAAGPDPPFPCPPLGRVVSDQLVVVLRSDGDAVFDSQYLHLSRIDVAPGQRVARGQVVGLSGMTGCSTVPHLHFQVRALGGLNPSALVDPYGWEGTTRDPWSQHPLGRASFWLWRPGEAPRLRPQ